MATPATIVIPRAGGGTDGDSAQGTGADIASDAAEAVGLLPLALLLPALAEQLGGADTDQGALGHVTVMMGMVLMVETILANVDHAVVAAVALIVPAAGGLGDGVAGAQLAAEATVVVIVAGPMAGIRVGRVAIQLGPLDHLVVGLARVDVDGTLIDDYRANLPRPRVAAIGVQVLRVLTFTFVVVPLGVGA